MLYALLSPYKLHAHTYAAILNRTKLLSTIYYKTVTEILLGMTIVYMHVCVCICVCVRVCVRAGVRVRAHTRCLRTLSNPSRVPRRREYCRPPPRTQSLDLDAA